MLFFTCPSLTEIKWFSLTQSKWSFSQERPLFLVPVKNYYTTVKAFVRRSSRPASTATGHLVKTILLSTFHRMLGLLYFKMKDICFASNHTLFVYFMQCCIQYNTVGTFVFRFMFKITCIQCKSHSTVLALSHSNDRK